MPTPSGVTTIDPIYTTSVLQVVRNPSGELVSPVIPAGDPPPPVDTSTRVFVFSS